MATELTARDWERVFPKWPSVSGGIDLIDILEEAQRSVDIISAIFLPMYWTGVIAPDQKTKEGIVSQVGRWCVTDSLLFCLNDEQYYIMSDRLNDSDWFSHLFEKEWLYDPSDFLLAYRAARELFIPNEQPHERDHAVDLQIQTAYSRVRFPFSSEAVLSNHLYLVHRMEDNERVAFCQFLADSKLLFD